MLYIGLTGGIGSGKSTVAHILQVMGYPVYISDTHASRLMNTCPEIKKELIALFGTMIYTSEGILDKKYLADIIFQDPAALSQVNHIVHPRVLDDFYVWSKTQTSSYVFFESAILFEARLNENFDFIICVTAPEAVKIQRVVERDKTTTEKVKERIRNQIDDTEKCGQSDFILYNDPAHLLLEQIDHLLKHLENRI